MEKRYYSRVRLTQEEAEKKLTDLLKNTPYVLLSPFVFNTVRKTKVEMHCPIHNFDWIVSWHDLVYHHKDVKKFGCKFCKVRYSKDACHKAALKCLQRSEFAKSYKGEYFAALRNGWLDEICSHMVVVGNHYNRCIYAYEFSNIEGQNYVYVGLTDNLPQRDLIHGRRGTVYTFCKKHNLERTKPIQLTNYINKEEAKTQEGVYLAKYVAKGWIPLNRIKTGGLGGHLANDGFSFEECKKRGEKYSKRSEWKREDYPTYYIACKRGWIDKILKQSERFGNSKQTYWTEERIFNTAQQYEYRSDFRKNDPVAYQQAYKRHILDKVCNHMKMKTMPTAYNVEIIIKEIEKYETLTDFIANNKKMYEWLSKHKIKLKDISDKPFKKLKGNPKPVDQFTMDGLFIRSYNSARDTKEYGFNYKSVSQVCHKKKKSHKGYVFRFRE